MTTRSGWLKPALWIPWLDRNGRFSALHGVTFLLLLLPGIIIATRWGLGDYQPRPVNEVVHRTGLWAIRILFVSLAITPLRQMLALPRLITVRRMIGVTAFAYVVVHLLLYALDEAFDLQKVATEILVRYYLLIGFCALILLGVLAATSTARSVRELGGRHWQNVHRLAYLVAVLAVAHHYMQSKVNVAEPVLMTGLLVWLLGYRLLARGGRGRGIALWTLLGWAWRRRCWRGCSRRPITSFSPAFPAPGCWTPMSSRRGNGCGRPGWCWRSPSGRRWRPMHRVG